CDLIQNDFPVVARPYAALGERLGESEQQVLERIARRTSSSWGRLAGSSRLVAFATGVFASAETP
ncbi:MAG TPA: AsnC family protein, partial [Gaiellales bacterium]|nr:AsnC family protein [Gaiellales bacterium]